jgi:mannose-6-phosphate isomerase-like protein (cupin superfamily)
MLKLHTIKLSEFNVMKEERLLPGRGSCLRKNDSKKLRISISCQSPNKVMVINGSLLITKKVKETIFTINPHEYYMIINIDEASITLKYNHDVLGHEIIYDPYKYEHSELADYDPNKFVKQFSVETGYIDILSKWYSIKFTYPEYNIIYIKPEMGISIQVHTHRSEEWEILCGEPIVINDNRVYYFVEEGTKFVNRKMQYHSVINPNKNPEEFVVLKERWSGVFDEEDIKRIYNPNNYQ